MNDNQEKGNNLPKEKGKKKSHAEEERFRKGWSEYSRTVRLSAAFHKARASMKKAVLHNQDLELVVTSYRTDTGRFMCTTQEKDYFVAYWIHDGHIFSTEPPAEGHTLEEAEAAAEKAEADHAHLVPMGLYPADEVPHHEI